jgi:hypothetical protein
VIEADVAGAFEATQGADVRGEPLRIVREPFDPVERRVQAFGQHQRQEVGGEGDVALALGDL